jgi:two-component system catabolic regulation response regulator CreB
MILERNLPLMDGIGLLEAFAALPGSRPLPVLLVGRALAAEDVRRGVQLGVRDCLAKPFSGAVVLERLGRMLKKAAPPPPPGRSVVYV